jgi:hypothetical protein
LLNCHGKHPTLYRLVEIRKQNALEERNETKLERKGRNMTFLELTEGRGLTENGIKMSEENVAIEQRV